tara:strand:- start:145 stop:375 length:231 start_codon:yes stop_codon:yes gene_type:complete
MLVNNDSDLKDFITKHYGSQRQLAKDLDVTTETVRKWLVKNPRGLLKYAPEIVRDKNVTASQIIWEVVHHERFLRD